MAGLGHSSTVGGPDLMSDWMFYHNLNPDKTRDLDLDRVLFHGSDSFLLGPTTAPMPAPQAPGLSGSLYRRSRRRMADGNRQLACGK